MTQYADQFDVGARGEQPPFDREAWLRQEVVKDADPLWVARNLGMCEFRGESYRDLPYDTVKELIGLVRDANPEAFAVRIFETSGDAYDATQYDEGIRDGDCLVIESERVVGLAWTWPVAITSRSGKLHAFSNPLVLTDEGDMGATREQVARAVKEAADRGYLVRAELI